MKIFAGWKKFRQCGKGRHNNILYEMAQDKNYRDKFSPIRLVRNYYKLLHNHGEFYNDNIIRC